MLALFTCLPGPLCPHAVKSSSGYPYYMSASVSRGYEEMLQGLLMLSNLTSTTFHQSAQVTDQPRLIGREWDFTTPSAVTLQKRTCRELAGIYCGHLCTVFHISLSPGLAILFAGLLSVLSMLQKAELYSLNSPYPFALCLLVGCASEKAGVFHLSLDSGTQFALLPKEMEHIRSDLTQDLHMPTKRTMSLSCS